MPAKAAIVNSTVFVAVAVKPGTLAALMASTLEKALPIDWPASEPAVETPTVTAEAEPT